MKLISAAVALVALAGAVAIQQASNATSSELDDAANVAVPSEDSDADAQWTPAAMMAAADLERTLSARAALGPAEKEPSHSVAANIVPAEDAAANQFELQSSGNSFVRPLIYNGRLFVKQPNGKNIACSAQFIGPSILLTAAHCIRDAKTKQWYSNVRFALQFNNGSSAKVYRTRCMMTSSGWVRDGTGPDRYDYALLVTDSPSITGHYGWAYGWKGSYHQASRVGYPAKLERGRVIQVDNGVLDFPHDQPGRVRMKHNNPRHTNGASGGAWVVNWSSVHDPRKNIVIGLSASHLKRNETIAFSPYFDEAFAATVAKAKIGCSR